ncbi:MAG: ferritin family protein [Thermoplasmata archaeon]
MDELKRLLEMALRSEIDSRDIYKKSAYSTKNALLKEKFEFLSGEEEKHRKMIENIIRMKYPDEDINVPESTEVPLPRVTVTEKDPISKLLSQAMDAEMAASKFYENLSTKFDDEKSYLMRYLSSVEMSHYYLLQAEREIILRFEDYDQYFEMMHVGP